MKAPAAVTSNSTDVPALTTTPFAQLTADPTRTYTYTFVPGGTDNGLFNLSTTGALSTTGTAPGGQQTFSVLVRATDTVFPTLTVDQVLTFSLVSAPTPVVLSNTTTGPNANTTVGTLSVTGSNRPITYSFATGGTDNGLFTLTPDGTLATGPGFPSTPTATYSILVRATDTAFTGLFTDTPFTISVVARPANPVLTVPASRQALEAQPVLMNITATNGGDGAVVTVTVSNVPANVTFSAGTKNGDGTWTFTQAQLVGLTATATDNSTFTLNVAATAAFGGGGLTSTVSNSIPVTIVNAPPVVVVSGPPVFNPTGAYALTVSVTNVGTDTVQSVTVNWGDGVIETFSGAGGTFTHQYLVRDSSYSVIVSVTDEDGTTTAPAVAVNAEFATPQQGVVAELFQTLLGTNADQASLDFFGTAIAAGVPLQTVVTFFMNTDAYRINAINNLFNEHLGRDATVLDLVQVYPLFLSGGSAAVEASILGSLEFFVKSGGTPESYVNALATAVFGCHWTTSPRTSWPVRF